MKGIGHLGDVFKDANPVEYYRVLNPYSAGTQVNVYHNDKQEDKTPTQQLQDVNARTGKSDCTQECNIGCDTPNTEIIERSQNSRSSKIRTRSRWISHRPEWLGIERQ